MSWYKIVIGNKIYCYRGSIDNALFSAARRHDFKNCGIIYYEKIEKPKGMSMAAFKRSIEK
jgi:hypothetical protein